MSTPQQQQQPQEPAHFRCVDCGDTSFFATPILDPLSRMTYDLQRCRSCGYIRWPEAARTA